jgi:GNAT superfamily N-acetyltransferase
MPTFPPTSLARVALVRRAEPGDGWAIQALFAALHAFNAGLESRFALAEGWERELSAHLARERELENGLTLLAWDGDQPVGLAMVAAHADSPLFRHRRWAELTALYVVPEARRGGIAAALLAAATAWAVGRGLGEVRLYVTASNEPARRFYRGHGFRPIQEIWTLDLPAALAAERPERIDPIAA